ncbi:hypothetical protein ACFL5O_01265 [Myxococcota bacterium]
MPSSDSPLAPARPTAPFEIHGRRYVRAPVPIHFPAQEDEQAGETEAHQAIREALASSLRLAYAAKALIGSDQFLYWDPTDLKKCLAPDLACGAEPGASCWRPGRSGNGALQSWLSRS